MKSSAEVLLVLCVLSTVNMATHATPDAVDLRSYSTTNESTTRELQYLNCVPPPNGVTGVWYYGFVAKEYRGCTTDHDSKPWIMLNAYRGGSARRSYWRYADDKTTLPCLKDWTYYGKDGEWVVTKVEGEWTKKGDNKQWCALPRYRKDGKRGFQWDYCTCKQA